MLKVLVCFLWSMHMHTSHSLPTPGQLVYMPLPPPPYDVIDDADDLERSPRSSPVGDAAMDLLQIRGDAVPDASLDLTVTPVSMLSLTS